MRVCVLLACQQCGAVILESKSHGASTNNPMPAIRRLRPVRSMTAGGGNDAQETRLEVANSATSTFPLPRRRSKCSTKDSCVRRRSLLPNCYAGPRSMPARNSATLRCFASRCRKSTFTRMPVNTINMPSQYQASSLGSVPGTPCSIKDQRSRAQVQSSSAKIFALILEHIPHTANEVTRPACFNWNRSST